MKKQEIRNETISRDGKPDATVKTSLLVDPNEQKQIISIEATVGGKTHEHRITVGAQSHPKPAAYDLAALERDIETGKAMAIAMADSHSHTAGLVDQLRLRWSEPEKK